jgi:methanogenic corrinoid protein MtbC1
MTTEGLDAPARAFFEFALSGDRPHAVGLVLELLNTGTPQDLIITDVLAPVQRRVGELWHQNRLSVASEHLVTGISESALYALANVAPVVPGTSLVAVACAEGDWHAIAAQMLAQQLQAQGLIVAFLGASTRSEDVARFLNRHDPDALVLSCSLPIFFRGIARLTDTAHAAGIPVMAGGRALQDAPEQASYLGVDGWAHTVDEAIEVLTRWRQRPLTIQGEPTILDRAAVELDAKADELASEAFIVLAERLAIMSNFTVSQVDRTREDLSFMVRWVAAALLVNDQTVFMDFLDWLIPLFATRGIPCSAVITGIESLEPLLHDLSPIAARFCTNGIEHVSERCEGERDRRVS